MNYAIRALTVLFLSASFFSCLTPNQSLVSQFGHLNQVKIKDGKEVKTGLWVEQGDSTNIQMAVYVDGRKQGLVRTVYRSGGYALTHYKDDVRDGKSTIYWNDGKAYRVETYVAGKMVDAVELGKR